MSSEYRLYIVTGVLQLFHPENGWWQERTERMRVRADEAVMVGDSVSHDVQGARRAGMRGVLIARDGRPRTLADDVIAIQSLRELPAML